MDLKNCKFLCEKAKATARLASLSYSGTPQPHYQHLYHLHQLQHFTSLFQEYADRERGPQTRVEVELG